MFTGWACEALLRADARAVLVGGLRPRLGGGVGLPWRVLWPSGLRLSVSAAEAGRRELLSGATPPAARVTHRGLLEAPPEDCCIEIKPAQFDGASSSSIFAVLTARNCMLACYTHLV